MSTLVPARKAEKKKPRLSGQQPDQNQPGRPRVTDAHAASVGALIQPGANHRLSRRPPRISPAVSQPSNLTSKLLSNVWPVSN